MSEALSLLALLFVAWVVADIRQHQKAANATLERIEQELDGLREYLYELDSQFNDEREVAERFQNGDIYAASDEINLLNAKKAAGKRTLDSRFKKPS